MAGGLFLKQAWRRRTAVYVRLTLEEEVASVFTDFAAAGISNSIIRRVHFTFPMGVKRRFSGWMSALRGVTSTEVGMEHLPPEDQQWQHNF